VQADENYHENNTVHIAYSQWRRLWRFESVCPAQSFVTVDRDVARNPPLVILQTVVHHGTEPKQQTINYKIPYIRK